MIMLQRDYGMTAATMAHLHEHVMEWTHRLQNYTYVVRA